MRILLLLVALLLFGCQASMPRVYTPFEADMKNHPPRYKQDPCPICKRFH